MNALLKIVAFTALIFFSCKSNKQPEAQSDIQVKDSLSISKSAWGKVENKDIYLYSLTNANGMKVDVTNFGAIIVSIFTKDKSDSLANVVMGFDSLAQYKTNPNFYGVTVGRYANRIANSKFKLDGKEYKLNANDGKNSLHGGAVGFHKKVWDAVELTGADSVALQLSYTSPDLEEGYPGNLNSTVTFVLNNANELKIYYSAQTDKPTVINLTNHSYFNLSGGKESILNHNLTIYADSITPVNSVLIPTGKIDAVKETAFDFTSAHKIGERIAQVKGGYDHNFVLSKAKGTYGLAVELADSTSGRVMEMYTSEPGVQFYSGNFLDGTFTGHDKVVYNQYWGLCLEAQHYPDSPNQPKFPSVVLKPGEKYYQLTVYKFSVKK